LIIINNDNDRPQDFQVGLTATKAGLKGSVREPWGGLRDGFLVDYNDDNPSVDTKVTRAPPYALLKERGGEDIYNDYGGIILGSLGYSLRTPIA
jgi:hypothetical protein